MAFRPRTPAPEPHLTRFDDHPAAAKLLQIRAALAAARADRERRAQILSIRFHLSGESGGLTSLKGPRASQQRERLAELERVAPPPKPENADPSGLPPEVARARRLIAGEDVEAEPDHAAQVKKLRRELEIVERALGSIEREIEKVRAELSTVFAEQLRAQHNEILQTILHSALALAAAVSAERELFASAILAGFTPRPDILNRPLLRAAGVIGSIEQYDADVNVFARQMENLGLA